MQHFRIHHHRSVVSLSCDMVSVTWIFQTSVQFLPRGSHPDFDVVQNRLKMPKPSICSPHPTIPFHTFFTLASSLSHVYLLAPHATPFSVEVPLAHCRSRGMLVSSGTTDVGPIHVGSACYMRCPMTETKIFFSTGPPCASEYNRSDL